MIALVLSIAWMLIRSLVLSIAWMLMIALVLSIAWVNDSISFKYSMGVNESFSLSIAWV